MLEQNISQYDQFGNLSPSKIPYTKGSGFDANPQYNEFIKSLSKEDFITVSAENMPSKFGMKPLDWEKVINMA